MRVRSTTKWGLAALGLALIFSLACGGEEDSAELQQQQLQEQVEMLEARKEALDEKRARLKELRGMEPAEEGAEAAEGAEGEEVMTREEIDAEIARLESEITEEARALYSDIVTAFNENAPDEGEPMNDLQRRILRLKSDEDIVMAQEHIVKGGNYEQAIRIYKEALRLDPEYERLEEALSRAQERRYMDEERFAKVEKGMTEEEVREVLGTPYYRNVSVTDQGLTLWLYPKSEQRDAAGVWFEEQGGTLEVVAKDFNAVEGQSAEEDAA